MRDASNLQASPMDIDVLIINGCSVLFWNRLNETVDDKEFRIGDLPGVRGRRRIDVHVAIAANQCGDADTITCNIRYEIAEN